MRVCHDCKVSVRVPLQSNGRAEPAWAPVLPIHEFGQLSCNSYPNPRVQLRRREAEMTGPPGQKQQWRHGSRLMLLASDHLCEACQREFASEETDLRELTSEAAIE